MSPGAIRAALWEALVQRAEAFHNVAVLGQRRATMQTASRLERLAGELNVLSRAINLLARGRTKP
jgi:hypothetical protein